MGKSAVKVFIRTRPTSSASENITIAESGKGIVVKLRKVDDGTVNNQLEKLNFKFENILHGVSQEQVFLQTTQELCDNALMGYNGTVFAYGQTGSGKTYSISGDTKAFEQRGVIPRALHYLFKEIEAREDREVVVRCSYLEIYNEELYDLLIENPGTAETLVIVEQNRSVFVKGLHKKQVANEEEALAAFFEGESGRSVAAHTLNANSSRSHVVFTVHFETRFGADERVVSSKINFVDLAGSERTKKTDVSGQALKEAMYINKSLTFLEQTVNALSKKEAHVPFRQSKLTAVLRDSLGGNCKTVMIGNIWTEDAHLEECVSTLRFASRVKTLVTDLSITASSDPTLLLRKYERQINDLKQELAMRDSLAGRARVSYEPLGDLERIQLQENVMGFIKGNVTLDELEIQSLQQVKETFLQFKACHDEITTKLAKNSRPIVAEDEKDAGLEGEDGDQQKGEDKPQEVGDVDGDTGTFSVGVAPSHMRPELDDMEMPAEDDEEAMLDSPTKLKTTQEGQPAFHTYKRTTAEGRDLSAIFSTQTAGLKQVKKQIRELATAVNEDKRQIEQLKADLAKTRAERAASSGAAPADPEEQAALQTFKERKLAYRNSFAELTKLREEVGPMQANIDQTRQRLVDGFNAWFNGGAASPSPAPGGDDEEADQEEQFEQMNLERNFTRNPESTAYHAAKKVMKPKNQGLFKHGDKGRAMLNRKLEADRAR
mmetsp:Transcript_7175/g.14560  ORF Transcript_7175/g.14560 Transcript_7175/m.14560 type:complete len:717 (-) Transcript_7175:232-2382(-)|eukprot:CAMPEP_0118931174 /NCGR_PEP_ID=MMETSP1169-20130426/7604_1 /TAXON_ID=36882 /ORGANISM="Pyramimonas obovata, Strain CCMP722" /LENGTH=716 /DNA_ID=CAMNT_0006873641 /DNA_START=105 /DNA_END=2255 /DNA_ORIENTATION=-